MSVHTYSQGQASQQAMDITLENFRVLQELVAFLIVEMKKRDNQVTLEVVWEKRAYQSRHHLPSSPGGVGSRTLSARTIKGMRAIVGGLARPTRTWRSDWPRWKAAS